LAPKLPNYCPTLAMVTVMSRGSILEKIKVDLDFLLAGILKKLFDSFAQFFTEQHKKILII